MGTLPQLFMIVDGNTTEGADLHRMFVQGQLVYTDATHKAWLDQEYNNLMLNPNIAVFQNFYASYLTTYHPYQMHMSYVGPA